MKIVIVWHFNLSSSCLPFTFKYTFDSYPHHLLLILTCLFIIYTSIIFICCSLPLTSILGRNRSRRSAAGGPRPKVAKITTWDRTIVCLPKSYLDIDGSSHGGQIAIPRKRRGILSQYGLIGKIHMESNWTETELMDEVRSVFKSSMGGQLDFPFEFLVPTGGGSRSLTRASVSATYKWKSKDVAGKAESTIYILAQKELKDEVCNIINEKDKICIQFCMHAKYYI